MHQRERERERERKKGTDRERDGGRYSGSPEDSPFPVSINSDGMQLFAALRGRVLTAAAAAGIKHTPHFRHTHINLHNRKMQRLSTISILHLFTAHTCAVAAGLAIELWR